MAKAQADAKTTVVAAALPRISMTDEEILAAFNKMQEQKDKQKARNAEKRQDPEFQAAQKLRNQKQKERKQAILAAAKKLGHELK